MNVQRIHSIQPAVGKLITVAARIRLDHADSLRLWFGACSTAPTPTQNPPSDGVFFQQEFLAGDDDVHVRGRILANGRDQVGIRLTPAFGGYKLIQRKHAVTPVADQLTIVAARLAISALGATRAWFGFWTANTDPFGSTPPADVAVIEKRDNSDGLFGFAKHDSSQWQTAQLLSLEANKLVDLCLVIHDNDRVDFICASPDGTWPAILLTSVGPFGTMQMGFAYKLAASSAMVVRSVQLAEVVLRE